MKKGKIVLFSLIHTLILSAYVLLISWIMWNGESKLGGGNNLITTAVLLMLFVLSAAICGLLIFGKPVKLYFDGKKKEGLKFLFWTIGWILIITIIVFVLMILI